MPAPNPNPPTGGTRAPTGTLTGAPEAPQYHQGAPHQRHYSLQVPPDLAGLPARPFSSDFDLWIRTGQWEQVSSSNVVAIKYDLAHQTLYVRYRGPVDWKYWPVSIEMVRGLYRTGSKGIWIHDHIRVRGRGNQHRHQVNASPA